MDEKSERELRQQAKSDELERRRKAEREANLDELQRKYAKTPQGKFAECLNQNAAAVPTPSSLRKPHQAAQKGLDALIRLNIVLKWLPGHAQVPGERSGHLNAVATVIDALRECEEVVESDGAEIFRSLTKGEFSASSTAGGDPERWFQLETGSRYPDQRCASCHELVFGMLSSVIRPKPNCATVIESDDDRAERIRFMVRLSYFHNIDGLGLRLELDREFHRALAARRASGHSYPIDSETLDVSAQIEEVLKGQNLRLFRTLKLRKHWVSYDTLAVEAGFRRGQDTADSGIQSALKRLQTALNEFPESGFSVTIEHPERRARLYR